MFWVFCNSCFVKPGQGNKRNFYMTSCSHIFCELCIRPDDTTCKRCRDRCMIVQCNASMPSEVKEVFGDVFDYPVNLIKAMDFQDFHRSRLLVQHKVLDQKYQAIKDIIKDMKTKLQILDQKYQSAKVLIRNKEEMIHELNRKVEFYKSKIQSSATPYRSSVPNLVKSNESLNHPNYHPSPFVRNPHAQQGFQTPFTPKPNFINYRNVNTPSVFTPESVRSKQSFASSGYSINLPPSAGGDKRSSLNEAPVNTPPSNTLALLSLMNRKRNLK